MYNIQSKTILFSLLILFISIKIVKVKTSFLEILGNWLNNGFFYYNCSILFCQNHVFSYLNKFGFYYNFYYHSFF